MFNPKIFCVNNNIKLLKFLVKTFNFAYWIVKPKLSVSECKLDRFEIDHQAGN